MFNEADLLDQVDNDIGFLGDTVEMLASDGPALVASIREAIEAGAASAVGRHAHALKGMISNFCAPEAQESALALEQMGKGGDLSAASGRLDALEGQLVVLIDELQAFVAERS